MMPLDRPRIGPFVDGDTLAFPSDNSSRHISPPQPSRWRARQSPARVIVEDPPPSDEEGEQCEHREDYYKYPGQRGGVTDLEILPANVIQVEDEEQRAVGRSAVGDDKTRSENLERCDQACYESEQDYWRRHRQSYVDEFVPRVRSIDRGGLVQWFRHLLEGG